MAQDSLEPIADIEAEKSLLGALLANNAYVDRAASLTGDDFSEPVLGRIFDEVCLVARQGTLANPMTISARMEADPSFRDIGGRGYLLRLAAVVGAEANIGLVDYLIDLARRRKIVAALTEGLAAARDPSIDLADTLEGVETQFSAAVVSDAGHASATIGQAFGPAIERVRQIARGEIDRGLLVPGFKDFDDITGGMKPGDYILVGARPSMGKTAVAIGVGRRVAQAGKPVLFISREMDIPGLMPRIMADLLDERGGEAGFQDILTGNVGERDFAILERLERDAAAWPLYFDAPTSLGAWQIAPLIRRYQRKCAARGTELALVVLDYLGLVDPPKGKGNREQEVAGTSLAIKGAAGSCRVPIITLTQLNRGVEQRDDKRPALHDLRESGSLEQDADVVMFVYRDEYYLDRAEPPADDVKKHEAWLIEKQASRNKIELYSAKARQGPLTKRTAHFFGSRQAIRNSDHYWTGGPR